MEAFLNLGNIGQDNRDHYSGGYMGLDDYNIESKIILSRFYYVERKQMDFANHIQFHNFRSNISLKVEWYFIRPSLWISNRLMLKKE